MPWIYALASRVLFALLWPLLALSRKTRGGWPERLGFLDALHLPSRPGPRIWLHGASAGDLLALVPLARELRAHLPDCLIVLSTITNSGRQLAEEKRAREPQFADAIFFAPFDLPGATRRAMKVIAPDLLVLEYTELWPNLIRAAKKSGARVALHNGRLSAKNLPRYRRLFSLIGNPLRELDLLLMRNDDERARALELGSWPENTRVTGDTKLDALLPALVHAEVEALRESFQLPPNAPVIVAGSTHVGEEALLLEVLVRLRTQFPELRMVIAPRYLDRSHEIFVLAQQRSLRASRRSAIEPESDVIMLDTLGELARVYALATVSFVGGSFTARGGQNILEPAAQGKVALFGPHMENFSDAVKLLADRGGIPVRDAAELEQKLRELLADSARREALGEQARQASLGVRGASARNAEALVALLGGSRLGRGND